MKKTTEVSQTSIETNAEEIALSKTETVDDNRAAKIAISRAVATENAAAKAVIIKDRIAKKDNEKESASKKIADLRERLLRGELPMSEEDFNKNFRSAGFEGLGAFMKPSYGESKYLAAAFHAFSCSPHFEFFCRSSIMAGKDGSFEVGIPLTGDGKKISIKQKDISPRLIAFSTIKDVFANFGMRTDKRLTIKPTEAPKGIQALEAAFLMKRICRDDFDAASRRYSEGISVGATEEVLGKIMGGNICRELDISLSRNRAELDFILENFDSERYILTGLSGKDLQYYSVARIDPEKRMITLADSRDTSRQSMISYEQFAKDFITLQGIEIDTPKLLERMKQQSEKM